MTPERAAAILRDHKNRFAETKVGQLEPLLVKIILVKKRARPAYLQATFNQRGCSNLLMSTDALSLGNSVVLHRNKLRSCSASPGG
jgi:hypothetical protein